MLDSFLSNPVAKIPSTEEVEIMQLDLARQLIVEADQSDDDARAINRDAIEGLAESALRNIQRVDPESGETPPRSIEERAGSRGGNEAGVPESPGSSSG